MDIHFFPQFPFDGRVLGFTRFNLAARKLVFETDIVKFPLAPFHAKNFSIILQNRSYHF